MALKRYRYPFCAGVIAFVFMATQRDEFAARYSDLGEAELLEVARDYMSLTEHAQAALRAEFARRGMEAPLVEGSDDEDMQQRKLVTLRRYRDLSEAIVARGMLESAEIEVFLQNENLVRLDWQISNGIGGIQLQVDESDVAAGRELLEQPVPESIPVVGVGEFEQPTCPQCGSAEITFEGAWRGAAVTGLWMFLLPLPMGKKTWVCSSCGARWENLDT